MKASLSVCKYFAAYIVKRISVDGWIETVIVQYEFLQNTAYYTNKEKPGRSFKKESYGSYLVYFDVESKKCVGRDKIKGPGFPKQISQIETVFSSYSVALGEILYEIESHLVDK